MPVSLYTHTIWENGLDFFKNEINMYIRTGIIEGIV